MVGEKGGNGKWASDATRVIISPGPALYQASYSQAAGISFPRAAKNCSRRSRRSSREHSTTQTLWLARRQTAGVTHCPLLSTEKPTLSGPLPGLCFPNKSALQISLQTGRAWRQLPALRSSGPREGHRTRDPQNSTAFPLEIPLEDQLTSIQSSSIHPRDRYENP